MEMTKKDFFLWMLNVPYYERGRVWGMLVDDKELKKFLLSKHDMFNEMLPIGLGPFNSDFVRGLNNGYSKTEWFESLSNEDKEIAVFHMDLWR